MDNLPQVEKILGVCFQNKNLLLQALTHRSYLNENRNWPYGNNEQIEFLGDSVLDLIVSEHLFKSLPDKSEGEFTELRKALVNNKFLSNLVQHLGLYRFLLVSRGEIRNKDNYKKWGCLFEAVVGAIYLDQGLNSAREFVHRVLISKSNEIIEQGFNDDYKGLLQEKTQDIFGIAPTYKILKEYGLDHNKSFVVGVYLEDYLMADGIGRSKKEAEIMASENALETKAWENKK